MKDHLNTSSWGRNIVVVYTAFALSTLAFVGFAMTQRVDLTSADYYEQALEHNATSLARKRGLATGVRVTADDSLRVAFSGDQFVTDRLEILLTRADNPALDTLQRLTVPRSNIVALPWKGLAPGVWSVRLTWTQNSQPHQYESRIRIGDR